MKKIISIFLTLCMIVCIPISASAATSVGSASYVLNGNSQYGQFAKMVLWAANDKTVNFSTDNCAKHVYGTNTIYTYEKTETVYCYSTSSLTSNYATAFSSLARTLNVADSASAGVRLGNTYKISSNYASGSYCFRAKFTCYKVVEEVITSTASSETVNWTKTITSAPKNTTGTIVIYKV